jgi:hypothetical protein
VKTKLTLTIDAALLPKAKRFARKRGVSLSALVESALRNLADGPAGESFVERWRGTMVLADRNDDRYRALKRRYE